MRFSRNVVVVTGGRNYANRDKVFAELDAIHAIKPITLLVEGGAIGADCHASHWAASRGVHGATVHALWSNGSSAGPVRNTVMMDVLPNLVVAFPGGDGTNNCVEAAKKARVEVKFVTDP